MRIIHFADLHIGVENYSRTDPETSLSTRLLDFLSALDQLVEYAIDQKADLVLLAGDAYKSRDPNQTQQREFARRLATLSAAGIPVFLLVGNHDLPNAMGRATAIEIFNTLEVPRLYVGDEIKTYLVETPSGPLQITALPWPKRSALLSREDTRGLSIEQVNKRLEALLAQGIRAAAQRLDPDVPAILAAHVTIDGAQLGSERAMMLGQDHKLRPSDLHLPAYDYVALGHIHKHQVVRENPLMVYAGSLQRVDFGEENDTKGFCVVDIDPDAPVGKRVGKNDFRFQPVDARTFTTIDVDLPPSTPDPTKQVIRAIRRSNVADAIVRLRISLTAEQSVQLRMGEIREALSPALTTWPPFNPRSPTNAAPASPPTPHETSTPYPPSLIIWKAATPIPVGVRNSSPTPEGCWTSRNSNKRPTPKSPMSLNDVLFLVMRWLHNIAAVAWVGGGIYYLLILRPRLRRSPQDTPNPGQDYLSLVNTAFGILLVTGAVLTFHRVTSGFIGVPYVAVLGREDIPGLLHVLPGKISPFPPLERTQAHHPANGSPPSPTPPPS